MRDPATRIDPEVEAAIEHAVKLIRPFARNGTLRRSDLPWCEMLKAMKSVDDGRRRRLGEWEKRLESIEISRPRGHPPFLFRRQVILLVLDEITALGFCRRRNPANHDRSDKRQSACSIVSAALYRLNAGMPEAAVVDLARPLRQKKRARR